jgi:hypothetical protein
MISSLDVGSQMKRLEKPIEAALLFSSSTKSRRRVAL